MSLADSFDIRRHVEQYSVVLAAAKTWYLDMGLNYHNLPLQVRRESVAPDHKLDCYIMFHNHHATTAALLGVDCTDVQVAQIPIVGHINTLQAQLEQLRVTNDEDEARALSLSFQVTGESLFDELVDLLFEVDNLIECWHVLYRRSAISEDLEADQLRQNIRNSWILSLPDVKRALELGLYENDEQAILETLAPEARLTDTFWEAMRRYYARAGISSAAREDVFSSSLAADDVPNNEDADN